jgi:hypothetical protein
MTLDHPRAKRLLGVMRQREDEARARLAAVQSEVTAVARSREDLLAVLMAGHPLHGLFTGLRSRRLAALAGQEQRLAAAAAACAQELAALQGQRRICERMLEAAGAALRREDEARQLDETIARLARGRIASPG